MRTMGVVLAALTTVAALAAPVSADSATESTHHHGTHHRSIQRYVALGDSYTAASGIPPSQTGSGGACLRSTRGYPTRLGRRLDADVVDVSCAGATTGDVDSSQTTGAGPAAPQLAAVTRRTDLVTVGLGINDAGFTAILTRCTQTAPEAIFPTDAPCEASFQTPGGDSLFAGLPAVRARLDHVLHEIKQQAPNARVVVVGYPQLVPAQGTCPELPFAPGDYPYVRAFFAGVEAQLGAAAADSGVDFLDVGAASLGHDACAGSQAWLEGKDNSPEAGAYHPFSREEHAVTRMLMADLPH